MLNNQLNSVNVGQNPINLGMDFSFEEIAGSNLRSHRSDLLDLIPLNQCVLVSCSRRESK